MTKEEGDEDEDGDEDKDKDLEICAAQTLDGWETGQDRTGQGLAPSLLLSNEYSYSATTASASRSLGLSRPS